MCSSCIDVGPSGEQIKAWGVLQALKDLITIRKLMTCSFYVSVALNFQTGGEPMQLNHGRFRDNGGAGYVLKPNLLLADEMFGIVTGNMDRNLCKVLALTVSFT